MPRIHGYSQIGKRCHGLRSFGEKKRTNAIGALYASKLMTVSLFDCNIDTVVFKTWVEKELLSKLPQKSVFVIDNASFHKDASIREVLEKNGHNLLYLPPYSPQYNPIEQKWSQAKMLKRKHQCDINTLFQKHDL